MKILRSIVACMLVSLLVAASLCVAETKKTETDYVAIVNETVITKGELDRELRLTQKYYEAMGSPMFDKHRAQIENQITEVLIDRVLLYQDSQKKKITVDEKAVQQQFEQWKAQYAPEGDLKDALAEYGFTEDSLRAELKKLLAIEYLIDAEFSSKVVVTEEEVKEFYDSHPDFFKKPEQVRARHILIKIDPSADEKQKADARKKLEAIKKQLDQGADFAALAEKNSQCPSSSKGGDLGYFGRGMMVKPFEEAAFSLEPNKVSDVVESNFGYHLIMVTDKQPAKVVSLEDSKENIEQHLKGQKIRQEVVEYVAVLKEKAVIKREAPGNAQSDTP